MRFIPLVLLSFSLFAQEPIPLKTPSLTKEKIIGKNVGVRPCRKNGMRLQLETIGNKLIVHSYGYGGSGITLSFGSSAEILQLLSNETIASKQAAVLGAGVIGLTAAYDLLNEGYEVHIYADDWIPNVTSNVAAGIWSPLFLPDSAPESQKTLNQRLLTTSYNRFLLSTMSPPEFEGVRWIDSYSFKIGEEPGAIKTKTGDEVVVRFESGAIKEGRLVKELAIDGKLFLEDLYAKVKAKGAIFHQAYFKALSDILALPEPIIINCTSLGSKTLFNDQDLYPVRGQLLYFEKDENFNSLLYQNILGSTNSWVSIYPWSDRIIVGGVYEVGIDELKTEEATLDSILEEAHHFLE